MTSNVTPTDNYGLSKINIYSNRDIWGAILNANFDLIDKSLADIAMAAAAAGVNSAVSKSRRISTGSGLSGGGTLANDLTISIVGGGISADLLADGAVTSAKIAAGAIVKSLGFTPADDANLAANYPSNHTLSVVLSSYAKLSDLHASEQAAATTYATIQALSNYVLSSDIVSIVNNRIAASLPALQTNTVV